MTLIELVVAIGIAGIIAYLTVTGIQNFSRSKESIDSRSDAQSEVTSFERRLTKYFRTRRLKADMVAKYGAGYPDSFDVSINCNSGSVTAGSPCFLDIYRRLNAGTGSETTDLYRFTTNCVALTSSEKSLLQKKGVSLSAVKDSVKAMCDQNFMCGDDERPVLEMSHCTGDPGSIGGSCTVESVPKGKVDVKRAIAGGFCVRWTNGAAATLINEPELAVEYGFVYVAESGSDKIKLQRRDQQIPVKQDLSNVEWLP